MAARRPETATVAVARTLELARQVVESSGREDGVEGMYVAERPGGRVVLSVLGTGDVYLRIAPSSGEQVVQRGRWELKDGRVAAQMTLDRTRRPLPRALDYVFARAEDGGLRLEKWDRTTLGDEAFSLGREM